MKKVIPIVLLAMAFATGCSSSKTASGAKAAKADYSFEYETTTRGRYQKLTVSHDTLVMTGDREMKTEQTAFITAEEVSNLQAAAASVDLPGMKDLVAPTDRRYFDAAAIAELTITKKGAAYKSVPFDHGNPPAAIKAVTDMIVALAANYKKE